MYVIVYKYAPVSENFIFGWQNIFKEYNENPTQTHLYVQQISGKLVQGVAARMCTQNMSDWNLGSF